MPLTPQQLAAFAKALESAKTEQEFRQVLVEAVPVGRSFSPDDLDPLDQMVARLSDTLRRESSE